MIKVQKSHRKNESYSLIVSFHIYFDENLNPEHADE
jgi:hypothetical protein